MNEPVRRIPRRSLLVTLVVLAAVVLLLELLRPGSLLRSLWPGSEELRRTPAQSVREGLEGRRPRRPNAPDS